MTPSELILTSGIPLARTVTRFPVLVTSFGTYLTNSEPLPVPSMANDALRLTRHRNRVELRNPESSF